MLNQTIYNLLLLQWCFFKIHILNLIIDPVNKLNKPVDLSVYINLQNGQKPIPAGLLPSQLDFGRICTNLKLFACNNIKAWIRVGRGSGIDVRKSMQQV